MDSEATFVTPAIVRIDCTDADELSERVSDWSIELKHLVPGDFAASLVLIPLGPALIGCGRFSKPMLVRTSPPEGCLTIARPGRGSAALYHHGSAVEDGQVFACGPGAEHESVGLGARYPMTLSIRCDLLARETDWLSHSSLPAAQGSSQTHEPGVAWTTSYLDAMEWIIDAVERYPEATLYGDRKSVV